MCFLFFPICYADTNQSGTVTGPPVPAKGVPLSKSLFGSEGTVSCSPSEWCSKSLDSSAAKNKHEIQVPIKDIQGNWQHYSPSQTSIKLNPPSYTLCNEQRDCAEGFLENNHIRVPQWNVIGTISRDARSITWSNGTRWERK
jgi:hypothetical protein